MRLSEFENLTHLLGKEMLHDEQKLTSSIDLKSVQYKPYDFEFTQLVIQIQRG